MSILPAQTEPGRRVRAVGGVVLLLSAVAGCPQDPGTCATVMIERTSEDANNAFEMFEATQCDGRFVDGNFELDLVDRSVEDGNLPRVLFTLAVDADEVPQDNAIDLARDNDTEPEPAIYQEWVNGTSPADGPFWTSNSGNITFTMNAEGNVTATFTFEADNPSMAGNTADGTIRVTGMVTRILLSE